MAVSELKRDWPVGTADATVVRHTDNDTESGEEDAAAAEGDRADSLSHHHATRGGVSNGSGLISLGLLF